MAWLVWGREEKNYRAGWGNLLSLTPLHQARRVGRVRDKGECEKATTARDRVHAESLRCEGGRGGARGCEQVTWAGCEGFGRPKRPAGLILSVYLLRD
jgi:hypothetical protein